MPNGPRSAVLRVAPKGGQRDTVESMSWAPQAWMKQKMAPEALRSFGSPWLLASMPGASRIGPDHWPTPGMGQFVIQTKGSAMVVTFPYQASLERGATIAGTEDWLMALPPASFNHFAKTSLGAVKVMENSVVWIPYGWVTMLVNCRGQLDVPQALAIPYLNAKLALGYPSLGLLVNFHYDYVKANQQNGSKHWREHGDSYLEWLATLNRQEDSSAVHAGTPIQGQPALMDIQGPAALMDGPVDDGESQPKDMETQGEDSQPKDEETPEGEN